MDDLELEEWLGLSEAQQDAILNREMTTYSRWYSRLSTKEQIAYCTRRALENCVAWRRVMHKLSASDFMRGLLRERQMRLLKIRAWRQTGVYPGSG